MSVGFIPLGQISVLRNDDFFRGHLPEIQREIVGFVDLSDYLCIIQVPWGFSAC
jgi:hypothetical protein